MTVSAIVPYFVTVILNYHGVTEQALSAVAAGTEEAGTGVELRKIFSFFFRFDYSFIYLIKSKDFFNFEKL